MNFTNLGYRGEFVQIAPAARLVPESQFFMLGSSYGNPSLIEKIFDECQREYLAANQDFDVTSPFAKLTCLDGAANRIYTTMLFLNDYIFNTYNKSSYTEGFEFLILQKINQKIYWSQTGWPHVFLSSGKNIFGLDHSMGHRSFRSSEAPVIPNSLLGVENSLNFRIESSILRRGEELLFVKSESLPTEFYSPAKTDNESLIKSIYKHDSKAGAWLGRLSFSDGQKVASNKAQSL